jgi:hypothetical protein
MDKLDEGKNYQLFENEEEVAEGVAVGDDKENLEEGTVQATFAAKAKQSHWAAMFSTCSYVGG